MIVLPIPRPSISDHLNSNSYAVPHPSGSIGFDYRTLRPQYCLSLVLHSVVSEPAMNAKACGWNRGSMPRLSHFYDWPRCPSPLPIGTLMLVKQCKMQPYPDTACWITRSTIFHSRSCFTCCRSATRSPPISSQSTRNGAASSLPR